MTDFSKDTLKTLWEQLTDDERLFFRSGRAPTWRESESLASRKLLEWVGSPIAGRYRLTSLGRALVTYADRLENEPQNAEDWRNNALGHIRLRLQSLREAMEGFDTTELDAVEAVQMSVYLALITELEEVQSLLGVEPE